MKQIIRFIIFLSICVTILNGCAYDEAKYPFVLHEYSTPGKGTYRNGEYRIYFNKYRNLIVKFMCSPGDTVGHDVCKYTIKGENVYAYNKDTGKDVLHLQYNISNDSFTVTFADGVTYKDFAGCVFQRVQ